MTATPTLRECTAADAEALALVGAATFLETFAGVLDGQAVIAHCAQAHDPSRYIQLLALGCRIWIAEAEPDRCPVGYVVAGPCLLPIARPGELDVKRIYVLSRWHGSGIGKALMAKAVDYARADHQDRLIVGVYKGNTRAQDFYESWGFEKIGERTFSVGPKQYEDFVYALTL
ncbi:MAG TPA: N-acetyltransferase [Caulobacteraceae bacterium]|jgi:ribosomal protein S18 acetylase RimI-like enzyme